MWGLNEDLFFPLRTLDIYAASLPTIAFSASITYQSFFVSFFNKRCHIDGDKYKE